MYFKERRKGLILVIIGAMLWGISGTVAQFLFQEKSFDPEWLVVIRLLSSGSLLLLYGYFKGNKNIKNILRLKKNRISLILFSIFGMLGVQYTFFAAINNGNAATATILQYLSPVLITCFYIIRNKKLPNLKELIAILLALTGTFFIITRGNLHSLYLSEATVFWGLGSALCAAFYTIHPIKLLKTFGSIAVLGWGMLIGGIAFSFIHSPFDFSGKVSASSLIAVAFIIIFGTLIAFYCYLESLKYLLPTESSVLSCTEPLSAAFVSVIWLKVTFGLPEFIGIFCIITTVIILAYTKETN